MKKRVLIGMSLILLVSLLIPWEGGHGLATPKKWVARYNGPGNGDDIAQAVVVDKSGNVYVTGTSKGSDPYGDYATIKYGPNGKQLWAGRYNGPGNDFDEARAIAVDVSGKVYVTGESVGSSTGRDYATVKYGSNGKQLWVRRYNGPSNDYDSASAMAVDGSGNVYVTGASGIAYNHDFVTIKYSPDGKQLWVNRYNGPRHVDDCARALAVDGSGNVYVTGASDGLGAENSLNDYNYATVKYSPSGKQLWARSYDGPVHGEDSASAIAVDGSGNVYVTGSSMGSKTSSPDDFATIKYRSNGQQLWVQRYKRSTNGNAMPQAMALDGSGNVYVTGWSTDANLNSDYTTIKYSPSGKQIWVGLYKGPVNRWRWDEAHALAVDGWGHVYVTGYSAGSNAAYPYDYATVKYDTNGKQLWAKRYNGPANNWDEAYAIVVDGSGNVYVTGKSWGSSSSYDYVTIKY